AQAADRQGPGQPRGARKEQGSQLQEMSVVVPRRQELGATAQHLSSSACKLMEVLVYYGAYGLRLREYLASSAIALFLSEEIVRERLGGVFLAVSCLVW
ncbi:Os01g0834900, partial [Oryza sativa Japonica Group]